MCLFVSPSILRKSKVLYCRNSVIPESYVGKEVKVYNGNRFISLEIMRRMVGCKFGEFVVTKKLGKAIHNKKKKKKNKGKKLRR